MMFLSPNPASRANQHVKSPFKHAVPKKKDFDDSSTYSVNILLQSQFLFPEQNMSKGAYMFVGLVTVLIGSTWVC